MEEIKVLLDNLVKRYTIAPIGYSIYGYNYNRMRLYDIYLPKKALDNFYFMSYKNGNLYDINSRIIESSYYKISRIATQGLIEKNFRKFFVYDEFFIK